MGGNITIRNGLIYQNGNVVKDIGRIRRKNINIIVQGEVDHLSVDNGDVTIKAEHVGEVKAANGRITCNDATSAVAYNGSIYANEVINATAHNGSVIRR